jgi:RNA polymerase primary sigma factor
MRRKVRSTKKSRTKRQPARREIGADRSELRERTRELLGREIHFIGNRSFCRQGAEQEILRGDDAIRRSRNTQTTSLPQGLPAHLARLCETRVLTAEDERDLFRRMNYLRFRANSLRSKLDPERPDEMAVNEIELLLRRASSIRDHIVQANIRLVISIVKKFVSPKHSFDDLLSDGIESLINAVDKFDYDRGFRFSTYAYRVVTRDAYRMIVTQQRNDARFDTAASDDLSLIPDRDRSSPLREHQWMRMRETSKSMIQHLDRREQFILRSRFALGAHRKVRTFQYLATKLGISKERVRQLEQRAISKLQAMAAERKLDA